MGTHKFSPKQQTKERAYTQLKSSYKKDRKNETFHGENNPYFPIKNNFILK